MIFNRNGNKPVAVLLGAGIMGVGIVRQIAVGSKILLGDISEQKLADVKNELVRSGYDVATCQVDAMQKDSIEAFAHVAASLGEVKYYIHTAGASPSQASPQHIIDLDLIGTSYALDAFGKIMARGGAGLVIASQAGHMLPALSDDDERAIATTPTAELHTLPQLSPERIPDSGIAYMMAKKGNMLRVRTAAATSWAERGARINTISPGIIVTPLAYDEFNAMGDAYQRMIDQSPARRVATADEVSAVGASLLSDKASFITGIDLLMDGGVIAALKSGTYQLG